MKNCYTEDQITYSVQSYCTEPPYIDKQVHEIVSVLDEPCASAFQEVLCRVHNFF